MRSQMDKEQHSNLCQSLYAFRQEFLTCLDQVCSAVIKDLEAWRSVVESRFQQKFSLIEQLLSGPYNRDLTWDWVTDDREFTDIAEFIKERKVRLRDDPSLEISAVEYFEKYARGNVSVLKVLQDAGYYTPPQNKFFQGFCKQLFSGAKTLLRQTELKKVEVPPGQVDLAFLRAQEIVQKDGELQKYCPTGVPILRLDKEYYLNVVNSLKGLPYTVIQPLTDEEQKTAARMRQTILTAEKTLNQTKSTLGKLNLIAVGIKHMEGIDPIVVDKFWLMYEEMSEELKTVETGQGKNGTEMMVIDE